VTRTADVIVVGGGVIGCAVARELARRGARVVLVERAEAGAEATRAAAGMVAPQAEAEGPGALVRLGVASRARYRAWVEALQEESGVDVEYRTAGIVYAALTAADTRVLAGRARWQRAAGLRVERLAPSEARRLVPPLARTVRAALHFPDDHQVNSERLGVAVALAARRAGAQVREHTPVVAVRAERGRVSGVETAVGVLAAPVVVNAAGAWAGRLALPRGVDPPPVFPVRGQMLVLRGGLEVLPRPLYCARGYLVPRVDGRVLAGSTLERGGYEKRVTAGAAADILGAARAMVPSVTGLTLEGAWAGLRPATPDRRPIIGPAADLAGLQYATGHYRSGILLAPVTADAIADLVLEGRSAIDLRGLDPARFARRGRAKGRSGAPDRSG
jgi:glycine oxidase